MFLKTLFSAFVILNFLFSVALAKEHTSANEALPRLESSAEMLMPDGRYVTIHRDAGVDGESNRAIYFHRPIFAFKLNSSNENGHQLIWRKVTEGEFTFFELQVFLSTPSLRQTAATAARSQDTKLSVGADQATDAAIEVKRWPIKILRMTAENVLTGEVYASTHAPRSRRAEGDLVKVRFRIASDKYDELITALEAGDIQFIPEYTFNNAITAFAQNSTDVSGKLVVELENSLQASMVIEGGPIFQKDRASLENTVRNIVTSTISATDASILGSVQSSDILSKLLTSETELLEDLAKNPELLARVDDYLRPIIREMDFSKVTTDSETDTESDTVTAVLKYEKVGSGTVTAEDKRVLQREHKVVLTESENRKVIEPYSIDVSYIRSGWQENVVNIVFSAFIAKGRDESFFEDTPVSSEFTEETLQEVVETSSAELSPYTAYHKGFTICSFRRDLPTGFERLDGNKKFPNETWLPAHLRGAIMPDMRDTFVRGATSSSDIASVDRDNILTIPQAVIDGGNFNAITTSAGGVFAKSEPFELVVQNTFIHRYKINTKKMFSGIVAGSQVIPKTDFDLQDPANFPPNVSCEWIIKVR